MTIPHLSARLTSMIFRRTLSVEIEGVRPELAILRNATLELKRSTRLRTILQVRQLSKTGFRPELIFVLYAVRIEAW